MPTQVQLPDGTIGEFPDGMKQEDIQSVLAKQFPPPPPPDPIHTQLQKAFDTVIAPKLHGMDQGVMGNAGTAALNVGKGILSLASPLVHPLKTAEDVGRAFPPVAAYQDLRHAFDPSQSPSVYQEQAQGAAEHPIESAEQMAGGLIGGKVIGAGVGAARNVMDPIRAYRSPLIPPEEATARAATDILKPNPLEYRNTVQSLAKRLPEAKSYLQKVGVEPKSPLEYSKGFSGTGKEASDFYRQNFIDPNADAPSGGGTVGSLHARLSDINDELRPIYRSRTMGEQMTKEAADRMQALEQERDNLNNTLYSTLSERSGLPVEQVKDINQRGAQLQHVGDVTDAAQATRRMGYGGFTPTGLPIPMGSLDRAMRLVDHLRGGPEAVAGRKLQRVFSQVPESTNPLPNPQDLSNARANFASQESERATANNATRGRRLRPQGEQ